MRLIGLFIAFGKWTGRFRGGRCSNPGPVGVVMLMWGIGSVLPAQSLADNLILNGGFETYSGSILWQTSQADYWKAGGALPSPPGPNDSTYVHRVSDSPHSGTYNEHLHTSGSALAFMLQKTANNSSLVILQ